MSVPATRWAIGAAPADLGGSGMAVLLVMADLANKDRWWQVWIPRDEIARRARVAYSTAGTALKALERADLISEVAPEERHPEVRKAAGRTVVYMLHVDVAIDRIEQSQNGPIDRIEQSQSPDSGDRIEAVPLIPRTQDELNASCSDPRERKRIAREITSAWWEWKTPKPMLPYMGAVKIIEAALGAGWSRAQVGRALKRLDGPLVKWRLEQELERGREKEADDEPVDPQAGFRTRRV